MSQLTDEQLQNTNSVIANGLEAKTMRHKIENKDLLSQKGALYVGTGNTTSTGAAVTTSIAPNSETDDGKVLIANSTANEGWQIGKITASNIEDGAVSPTKLNLQSDYAVKTLTVHATDSLDEQFAKYTNTGIEYAGINDSFNTLVYPTELPDTTGTVATKEQIENGDIIVKTAQNATNAQKTDFSNAEWQQCLKKTVDNKDVYYFDIPEKGTYEIDCRPYGFSKQVSGLVTLDFIYYPMKEVTVSSDIELLESSDGWVRINSAVLKIEGSEAVLYDRSATISLPNGTIGKLENSIGFKYRRIR